MINHEQPQRLPIAAVVITALATLCIVGLIVGALFIFGVLNTSDKANKMSDTNSTGSTDNTSQLSVGAPASVPACGSHQAIDSRTWLEIAKDPEAHKGECIVVYGEVMQFDSATGTDTFRANVDGVQQTPQYGFVNYSTNTILTGDTQLLKDVVEKDLFSAGVTVLGSESYDTQIGGHTIVPKLRVDTIQVTDHLSS